MTDKIQEQISALVDDEIHDMELKTVIAELTKNQASAERWQRYNLISDVLRN
ncbi:MAG TPA: anti-sigma factor, partial [Gammaproteobacteria bacterium]|nr:anti-sigma factor [Gammaproteobacteria bacterium]